MGLKRAVMVVAGWETTWGKKEEDADGSADVEDDLVEGWNEGGVASGSVVKRMPVDTVEKKKQCVSVSAAQSEGRRDVNNLLRSSPWR